MSGTDFAAPAPGNGLIPAGARGFEENTMTWEQKLAALQAIADTSLRMRKPGDWYVDSRGRDVGGNGFLTGAFGEGETPEEAVNDDWEVVTNLEPGRYLQLRDGRRVRWNGFMWVDVPKD